MTTGTHGRTVTEPAPGALLSVVTRGDAVESWHRGSVVVVQGDKVVFAAGDVDQAIWCRSAVKPFQALPLFDCGIVAAQAFSDEELALCSASHEGTELHTATVSGLLRRGGFTVDDLGCGASAPFDKATSLAIARAGQKPQRLHHNCSGKHAGFLYLARVCGVRLGDYLLPESASQQLVRAAVADMAQVPLAEITTAVDGCTAPTLRLPLSALAHAFRRLTNPDELPPQRAAACARLRAAVNRAPVHLAGEGRLCTALLREGGGRFYPKNGAEGVYALGIAELDLGIAIKVDDGATRGYPPVVIALLRHLGVWSSVPATLADFARTPVRNSRKDIVGHVECALEF